MSRPTPRTIRCLVTLASASAVLVLSGCRSAEQTRLQEIRSNPTPELALASMTKDESANRGAVLWDRAGLDIKEDFLRFFHLDSPSLLSPTPSIR